MTSSGQGKRFTPAMQAEWTAHHSTKHTWLTTLPDLSYAGRRVEQAHSIYGTFRLRPGPLNANKIHFQSLGTKHWPLVLCGTRY
jgi:hypothetical protein